jgi:hypothetical protein
MVVDAWGLWNQNIGISQIRDATRMIAFAAKWYGEKPVSFFSEFHDGRDEMASAAHELLEAADVVVHFNGTTFDIPHMNREFAVRGWLPPAPYQQVDLLRVVKKNFRFPSNKLQYVSTALGLEGKAQHEGHNLWVRCLAGDAAAWREMKRYNKQDVVVTEKLYDKLLPWIGNHPHRGLYDGTDGLACNRCGSQDLRPRGFSYTAVSRFQRYRCDDCGGWMRDNKVIARVSHRGLGA